MERKLKRRGPDAPHNDCANDSNDRPRNDSQTQRHWQPSHGGDKTNQRRSRQKAEITHRRDRRNAGAPATPFEPACRAINDGHPLGRAVKRQNVYCPDFSFSVCYANGAQL